MPQNPRPTVTQLFLSFLRLGATAFGGPSMVVYIRRLAVERKRWLDGDTFGDGVALAQMVPGATAMQTAAYVGLKSRGVAGAGACYVGFGLPAFLLMMTFAALYTRARDLPAVASAFSGLEAVIVAVVANAAVVFGKTTLRGLRATVIAAAAAVLFGFRVSPVLVIALAAVGGIALLRSEHPLKHPPSMRSGPAATTFPYKRQLALILSVAAVGLLALLLFNRSLFRLAVLLARIDLLAFGGGFASVPLMLHEIVEARGWIDGHTFINGIILGQITPGPIVITATFIGYLMGGPLWGVVATIGMLLPSFVVIVWLSAYVERLRASTAFNGIVRGVLCSFVGLLFAVAIRFAMGVHWDAAHLILAGGAFAALTLKVDLLWVVVVGAAASIVMFM